MSRDEFDADVLATIEVHPGCTAREITETLEGRRVHSQAISPVYDALARLELRGLVVKDRGVANRWTAVAPDERPVTLTAKEAHLCAHVLRCGVQAGTLGEPSAAVAETIDRQLRGMLCR
jgi:hypothetical protein